MPHFLHGFLNHAHLCVVRSGVCLSGVARTFLLILFDPSNALGQFASLLEVDHVAQQEVRVAVLGECQVRQEDAQVRNAGRQALLQHSSEIAAVLVAPKQVGKLGEARRSLGAQGGLGALEAVDRIAAQTAVDRKQRIEVVEGTTLLQT